MSVSGPISPQIVEQAQRRLRETLAELRLLSAQIDDRDGFFATWLSRVIEVTSADAGYLWHRFEENHWRPAYRGGGRAEADVEHDPFAEQRRTGLPEAIGSGTPRAGVLSPSQSQIEEGVRTGTALWFPVVIAHTVVAVIELQIAVESEAAQRGCLRFLADASESYERFYLLDERRQRDAKQADEEAERRLSDALFSKLHSKATAYSLANEGRLLIGCDRVSVLVRRGRTYRVSAVSGQEIFDSRAGVIRAIEALTSRIAAVGRTVAFPDEKDEEQAVFMEDFEIYVDVSHSKRVAIVPLIPPPETDVEGKTITKPSIGAMVVEYFEAAPWTDLERSRIERTAKVGTSAMNAALENEALFLLPLWRTLGKLKKSWLEPGTKRRTYLITAAVVVVLATLFLYPADYTAFSRGTMQPVVRRHIFAPQDGTVKHIVVKHGQHVKPGDLLLEMRNTDLEIAAAEAQGRRTSLAEQLVGVERTLFDEGRRLTSEERSRLSGQRSELREQIASLDRQLELYAEKRERLKVTSPIEGEVTTWSAEQLLDNRPVRQGQVLLSVADTAGKWELELNVPEARSGRMVRVPFPPRVTYSPALDPGTVREGIVTEIQNSAELRGEEGNTVLVRASMTPEDLERDIHQNKRYRPGAEVAAHIHCGKRPLGYVWLSDIVDFLRAKVMFRWF